MTQDEIKALASEIVGDGQTPNRFFVTTSPHVYVITEGGDHDFELLEGFSNEDSETEVFETYDDAKEYYESVDLDVYSGTSYVILEDRLTGVISEKSLEKFVSVEYSFMEHSDAKQFGYEK